ncbi:MAG: acyclic terpene utilization AtuA family protein [Burkholderiales bacterium]|nr:acyclic terpene utilization AtuA family protein [Burkholderiales bacterium]
MAGTSSEIRVLSPTGVCGSGFLESSFETALRWQPHVIGCDAGSTDPGPAYLGASRTAFPKDAIERDLRLMLRGARRIGVPLVVGSAGTGGNDAQLELMRGLARKIAAEEGLGFTLALIHAEQDKAYLKRRLREGRVKPLDPAPPFDEATIDRSEHIVGMMGAEPFQRALAAGADVVLAGRASDTAVFASYPLMHGIPAGIAWHAAKILECGAASVVSRRTPDCMFAWLRADHFVVEAPDPALRCTPQSIASHSLYENADPFRLVECSGTLDLTGSRYEPAGERSVRVTGSAFEHAARYTVKLEGAERIGYQSILIGSIRDPYFIRQIDDWLARLRKRIHERVTQVYGAGLKPDEFTFNIRVYGKDGTMGPLEPVKEIRSHELALVFEVTAPTQEIASSIAGITRHQALHLPIPEWSGLITALACPYNHLDRGAVYSFNVNHVVEPDDPYEMFPMEFIRVERGAERRLAAAEVELATDGRR